jgi:putative ABC transport system permease protein
VSWTSPSGRSSTGSGLDTSWILDGATFGLAEAVSDQLDQLLGVALGIPFGAAFTSVEVFDIDTFVLPWGQLAAGLVAAVVAGLLAGVLPARRAARMDVLRALQAD